MGNLLFDGWEGALRNAIAGVLAYVTLVIFLRISGKRTLSKMNAFDLVVTVSLGSTLATVLLSKAVALVDGAIAFGVLVGLQYAVTWTSVRARWVRQAVTGEPLMLMHRGHFLPSALRKARVTRDEVRAAVRAAGLASLKEVEAVVLETDGSFSAIRRGGGCSLSSLEGVRGATGSSSTP